MKHLRFVLAALGVILLGALMVRSATARISSQAPPGFAEIALHPQEFPEAWHPFKSAEGVAQPNDQRHPLNRFNPLIIESDQKELGDFLYNYIGYYQETFIWDGRSSGLVGNYLYQYASEDQARRVAQAITAAFQQASPAAVYEIPKKDGLIIGWAGRFQGEEEGDTEWFVTTHKNILILLVVDGPSGRFEAGFLHLVERLLARLE